MELLTTGGTFSPGPAQASQQPALGQVYPGGFDVPSPNLPQPHPSCFATSWPTTPLEDSQPVPAARSILEFARNEPKPEMTVLGARLLCRSGSMLFVGPSGVGKSSASAQQDILWALGQEAFGIKPARPTKILTIQAENDDGDLHEMAKGVLEGGLFPKGSYTQAHEELLEKNCLYVTIDDRIGEDFIQAVAELLELHKPDLLRLDHLTAYCGCDPTDTSGVIWFLRQGLNPLLKKHGCACIVNHHTPKITNRDTSKWSGLDFSYAGAGSAALTNWARSVIVINQTAVPHVFEFIAAKRGRRIGWTEVGGAKIIRRMFAHDISGGHICWKDASAADIELASKKKGDADIRAMLIAEVTSVGSIGKDALIDRIYQTGVAGKKKISDALKSILESDESELIELEEPRPGTNAKKVISLRGVVER